MDVGCCFIVRMMFELARFETAADKTSTTSYLYVSPPATKVAKRRCKGTIISKTDQKFLPSQSLTPVDEQQSIG